MNEYNKSNHAIYNIKYHIIWVTKYRYHVLNGNIAPSKLVQYLKGGSSRLLQEQFPELQKRER